MRLVLKNTSLKFEVVKGLEPFGGSSNAIANQYIDTIKLTVTGNFTFTGKIYLVHYYNSDRGHVTNWQLFQTTGMDSDTKGENLVAQFLPMITFPLSDSAKYTSNECNGKSGTSAEGCIFKLEVEGDLASYYSAVEAATVDGDKSAKVIIDNGHKVNIL
jgi:hypothetical protein